MTASDLEGAWRQQIAFCDGSGSPFTARVLEAAWANRVDGGGLRQALPAWPGDAWADAVPLRVAGALHSLVLDGTDPNLAAIYPPSSATFHPVRGPAAVRAALDGHPDRLAEYLRGPPQTNEIGRSAVLLGGFAAIAQATGLPLATLEIGASAGLNTQWPFYRYELGPMSWGDPASPVLIRSAWEGAPPAFPAQIRVASWAACDIAPIDLRAPGAATRLESYVWADQRERLARLQAAVQFALDQRVAVERADAADFLARELAQPRPGRTVVLYHSIVWQYLPAVLRATLHTLIEQAGARATPAAPFAWLAFEPVSASATPQLALTLWPGGQRVVLAEAHPHGALVKWQVFARANG
jgi:hypothetical protein